MTTLINNIKTILGNTNGIIYIGAIATAVPLENWIIDPYRTLYKVGLTSVTISIIDILVLPSRCQVLFRSACLIGMGMGVSKYIYDFTTVSLPTSVTNSILSDTAANSS